MQGFVFTAAFQQRNIGKVRLRNAVYFCLVMAKWLPAYTSHSISEELTLKESSHIPDYPPPHLHRITKEKFGTPIGNFIEHLATATQPLLLANIPVSEIKYFVSNKLVAFFQSHVVGLQ